MSPTSYQTAPPRGAAKKSLRRAEGLRVKGVRDVDGFARVLRGRLEVPAGAVRFQRPVGSSAG